MKTSFSSLIRIFAMGGAMSASLAAGAAQIVVGQVAPLSGLEAYQARLFNRYSTGPEQGQHRGRREWPYLQLGEER